MCTCTMHVCVPSQHQFYQYMYIFSICNVILCSCFYTLDITSEVSVEATKMFSKSGNSSIPMSNDTGEIIMAGCIYNFRTAACIRYPTFPLVHES